MDASTHFRERGALISGLMSGEVDAADAVARTRPAVQVLGLLVPIDGLTERYLHGRSPKGPLLASGDPQLVLSILRRVTTKVPGLRWAAYATLARMAGPEPVWALEQERAGTLARMDEPVRASMAAGSAAPILAAAEATPVTIGPAGSAMALGAPQIEPWPYTELIREFVDGDEHRRTVVDNLPADRTSSTRLGRSAEVLAPGLQNREDAGSNPVVRAAL
jgi:hypothetical protein